MTTPSVYYQLDETGLRSWGELVGDFHIMGDIGEIAEVDTYIDSWLACLGEGLDAVRLGGRTQVEIPEEREPLHLERVGNGLVIRYGATSAQFSSLERFEHGLVSAASRLVNRAKELNLDRNGAFVASVELLAAKEI